MFEKISYKRKYLILTVFFTLFFTSIIVVEYYGEKSGQGIINENIAELHNDYISTLRSETREKVLQILEDAEVQKTLERIRNSDEFYKKDGAIFLNREKRLPIKRNREYYSEWTVKTPGEKTRGTKRIVVGEEGEMYFTDDHYETFLRVK